MSDLVAFLRARYDEMEQDARESRGLLEDVPHWSLPDWVNGRFMLADIAAKRQILDMWEDPAWVEDPTLHPDVDPEHYQDGRDWNECDEQVAEANAIDQVVRLLAQPFRAHPDFDPAWAVDAP